MKRVWLDFETLSPYDIKEVGGFKYARHCEPLLLAWAVDDGPVNIWDNRSMEPLPQSLIKALDGADEIWAHNATFDRTVMESQLGLKYPGKWRDTMTLAYSCGLPGSLEALCEYYGLPADEAKDKEGKRLIKVFCTGKEKEKENDWEKFVSYCQQDVAAMRTVYQHLPKYNDAKPFWKDYELDYQINARGVPVDIPLCEGAVDACQKAAKENEARCRELTGLAPTQVGALKDWIYAQSGLGLPDLAKDTCEKVYAETDNEFVKGAIGCRLAAAKSSVKKYETILACADEGRVRGTLVFCGASRTGRFAGRLMQTQNLPRPTLQDEEIEEAIKHFTAKDYFYGPKSPDIAASCLRATIHGNLSVADLSAIEGRVLAWLAGEQWKLDAFAAGRDMYKETFSRTFGKPCETKAERQLGKVLELALGYQGGVGAFCNFARVYGIDLETLPSPKSHFEDISEFDPRHGLSVKAFRVVQQIKLAWRNAHPAIRQFWNKVAGLDGGDHMKITQTEDGLRVRLPSGRSIFYPKFCDMSFYAQIPGHVGWGMQRIHSGILTENVTQAVARDILMRGLQNAEKAGFKVVSHVHDEIIAERTGDLNSDDLVRCMITMPKWAEGLPLNAEGFDTLRYKK